MSNPTAVYYTGNGATTDFVFSFDYIDASHIKVYLNGVLTTHTLISQNTVRLSPAPSNGVSVAVKRETPGDPLVTWADGAVILGENLNTASEQPRMIAEEARDKASDGFFLNNTRTAYDANNKRISNLGTPTAATDAATKDYVDNGVNSSVVAAAASAAAAAASQSAAAASQAAAAASATGAAGSATTATTKAGEASTSATNAAASAATATTKAGEANTSATNAAASASTATTKAGEASASAAAAAASAAAADASAASAAASVVAAASSFDAFDDRYLGQKAADPALDNDGNALVMGALYFNTGIGKMKVYNGSGWQLAFNDTVAASAVPNDSGVAGANVAAALDTLNSGKAATAHTHAIADVTNLQTTLDGKQDASANLTSWSALAPSVKMDYSANLNSWSGIDPATKANLTGGVFTGAIGVAPASSGKISLLGGTPTNTGYVEWRKADNTRLGYMGFNNTDVEIVTEGGAFLRLNGQIVWSYGNTATTAQIRANTSVSSTLGWPHHNQLWDAMDLVTLTDAATIAVDLSTMINAKVTLGGNRTLGNPTNVKPGQSGVILIRQDGTGSRTLAFGANWRFPNAVAPTLSTTAGYCDKLFYFVESSSFIHAELVKDSR
jgi:hypothetical protein